MKRLPKHREDHWQADTTRAMEAIASRIPGVEVLPVTNEDWLVWGDVPAEIAAPSILMARGANKSFKPHTNVGDRGQRYAVMVCNYPSPGWSVCGWAPKLDGAMRLGSTLVRALSAAGFRIYDREDGDIMVYQEMKSRRETHNA